MGPLYPAPRHHIQDGLEGAGLPGPCLTPEVPLREGQPTGPQLEAVLEEVEAPARGDIESPRHVDPGPDPLEGEGALQIQLDLGTDDVHRVQEGERHPADLPPIRSPVPGRPREQPDQLDRGVRGDRADLGDLIIREEDGALGDADLDGALPGGRRQADGHAAGEQGHGQPLAHHGQINELEIDRAGHGPGAPQGRRLRRARIRHLPGQGAAPLDLARRGERDQLLDLQCVAGEPSPPGDAAESASDGEEGERRVVEAQCPVQPWGPEGPVDVHRGADVARGRVHPCAEEGHHASRGERRCHHAPERGVSYRSAGAAHCDQRNLRSEIHDQLIGSQGKSQVLLRWGHVEPGLDIDPVPAEVEDPLQDRGALEVIQGPGRLEDEPQVDVHAVGHRPERAQGLGAHDAGDDGDAVLLGVAPDQGRSVGVEVQGELRREGDQGILQCAEPSIESGPPGVVEEREAEIPEGGPAPGRLLDEDGPLRRRGAGVSPDGDLPGDPPGEGRAEEDRAQLAEVQAPELQRRGRRPRRPGHRPADEIDVEGEGRLQRDGPRGPPERDAEGRLRIRRRPELASQATDRGPGDEDLGHLDPEEAMHAVAIHGGRERDVRGPLDARGRPPCRNQIRQVHLPRHGEVRVLGDGLSRRAGCSRGRQKEGDGDEHPAQHQNVSPKPK